MISNRHIRHDWQTFVNWEQKSVKTVCNQKSTPRLCGIPGFTAQPKVVDSRPGWCPNCIRRIVDGIPYNSSPLLEIVRSVQDDPHVNFKVIQLYYQIAREVALIVEELVKGR